MKSIKRYIASALTILIAMSIFTSCNNSVENVESITQKGKITLSWDFNVKKDVWQAIADEYTRINPEVEIVIDQKDGSSYATWLSNQLSSADPTPDIVINNEVKQFMADKKFVDYSQYLGKKNPYAGNQVWKEMLDEMAYQANGSNQEIYSLNTDSVMTTWFYNKDIFAKYNLDPPKTWDELITISKTLKSNGIIPLAIAGDAMSFWAWQMGWIFRVYTDQYFRDYEDKVIAQPGDYNYDKELQSDWKFDKNDKLNDNQKGYIVNLIRFAKMVNDGETGPNTDKFKDMVVNLKKFFPEYVPSGFIGTDNTTAVQYFIKGEAAMWIDLASFGAGFERTMSDAGTNKFNLGVFNYPAMTGDKAGVNYARTTGGASGYFGVVAKSKEQNDLVMDFMMFTASPEGQKVYFRKMEELNIAPTGPSLIKGVKMPEKWASTFEQLGVPGLADSNPYAAFSRGFMDTPKSVRDFQDNSQLLFDNKMTVEEYCIQMQASCVTNIKTWLKIKGFRPDALDDPKADPLIK